MLSEQDKSVDLEALTAWMDGELDEAAAAQVAKRVENDPAWKAAHRQLQAVDAALDLLPRPAMKVDLTDRIMRTTRRQNRVAWVIRLASPLAAAACLLVAVMIWHNMQNAGGNLANRPASVKPGGDANPSQTTDGGPLAGSGLQSYIDLALGDVPKQDRFIVQNLEMFRNYDQVSEFRKVSEVVDPATLSALEELETR